MYGSVRQLQDENGVRFELWENLVQRERVLSCPDKVVYVAMEDMLKHRAGICVSCLLNTGELSFVSDSFILRGMRPKDTKERQFVFHQCPVCGFMSSATEVNHIKGIVSWETRVVPELEL